MTRIVIIIPTYNEAANTPRMIDALAPLVAGTDTYDLHVLYVDAMSPDGTGDIVRERQSTFPWLHLLREDKKEGLGAAYAKGMRHAITTLGADYLMEFDGDFQHAPADIARLIAEIETGCDYVIGSRYVPGACTAAGWSRRRRILSRCGALVVRTLLGVRHIHDVTSGFRLSRVENFMDSFDFASLISKSYAYKIELLHYMMVRGARITEVPIHFATRSAGTSKMPAREITETLRVIGRLKLRRCAHYRPAST